MSTRLARTSHLTCRTFLLPYPYPYPYPPPYPYRYPYQRRSTFNVHEGEREGEAPPSTRRHRPESSRISCGCSSIVEHLSAVSSAGIVIFECSAARRPPCGNSGDNGYGGRYRFRNRWRAPSLGSVQPACRTLLYPYPSPSEWRAVHAPALVAFTPASRSGGPTRRSTPDRRNASSAEAETETEWRANLPVSRCGWSRLLARCEFRDASDYRGRDRDGNGDRDGYRKRRPERASLGRKRVLGDVLQDAADRHEADGLAIAKHDDVAIAAHTHEIQRVRQ